MYRPRLTADQLCRIHGTAEAAFRAADLFTAIRLADGDSEIAGMALTMLGHEHRGLKVLEGAGGLAPRARVIQALGLWLAGACDSQARAMARSCAADGNEASPAAALLRAMDAERPHIVAYCTAANTLQAADMLKACPDARVTVLRNVPVKADVAFAPDTTPAQLGGALDDPVDCVLVDNLLMLPPQLAAIDAPKIAQVSDIEFAYAQRGRELAWLDLIVSVGNSTEHMNARVRFGDHVVMRLQGLEEFRDLDIDPARLHDDALAMDRPIDALVTGGVDKPFYPDKQQRFSALAQADADLRIDIIARYLPFERYQALTRMAKYAVLSNRMAQIVTRRAVETLAAGTMLACEQDHAMNLLFGDDLAGVHGYRDGHIAQDIARLVADFPRHQEAFARSLPALVETLRHLYPTPETAIRRSVRYLTFWSEMAKAGLDWRQLAAGDAAVGHRSMSRPTATDCYAAKQESWLGLPPKLRGRLLAPMARIDTDALAMPRLGQTVTAQAFLALNAHDEDLYRYQAEGQFRARAAILRTLNMARRRHPRSLSTWYLIGRHLAEVGRFKVAIRVLGMLVDRAGELELEPRVTMVDGQYEVNDFPFVDAVAADDLARAYPAAMGPFSERARQWVLGRAYGLLAAMHAVGGDVSAFRAHARQALALAGRDLVVLDHVQSGAVRAWQMQNAERDLALAAVAGLVAMRLAPRTLFDRFPDALRILTMLGRDRLGDLLTRRWLRAKARIFLEAEAPVATDAESEVLAEDPARFQRNAAAFENTGLHDRITALAVDLGVAGDRRDAA